MAIETAAEPGAVQTELAVESREERLTKLFDMEWNIRELKGERQKHVDRANALKNEIKAKEKEKDELMEKINSGQGTFITVPVSADNDADPEPLDGEEEYPSDDELEAFGDKPSEGEQNEPNEPNEPNEQSGEQKTEGEENPETEPETSENPDDSGEVSNENLEKNDPETQEEEAPADDAQQGTDANPEQAQTETEADEAPEQGKPEEWAVFNVNWDKGLFSLPRKVKPKVGMTYPVPKHCRDEANRYFVVRDFKLNKSANRWEVAAECMSEEDWNEFVDEKSKSQEGSAA